MNYSNNIRYKILSTVAYLSQQGIGHPCILIISESDSGKTSTVNAIKRDIDTAYTLPPISESELQEYLKKQRNASLIILDDLSDWDSKALRIGFKAMKHMISGEIVASRKTMFQSGIPSEAGISTAILCNSYQYDRTMQQMKDVGLSQRAVIIRTEHTKEQMKNIMKQFKQFKYSKLKYPYFQLNGFELGYHTVAEDILEWIENSFSGEKADAIEKIASVVPYEQFQAFKPYFQSDFKMRNEPEDILLCEMPKKKE